MEKSNRTATRLALLEELEEERRHAWRQRYDYDFDLDVDPEDYDTAEEFAEALEEAREALEKEKYGWRENYEWDVELGLDPEDYETEEEYINALDDVRYSWRSYAEDGALFGVNPLDYEKEKDYNKALEQARKTYCRNKRTYEAAEYYRGEEAAFRRAAFILQGLQEESCIASRYCTLDGEFLFAQAVSDHFTLPVRFAREDESRKNSLSEVISRIGKQNTDLAVNVWRWCLSEFSPYSEYQEYPEELFNYVIDSMSERVLDTVARHCGKDPAFAGQFLRNNPQSPERGSMAESIMAALKHVSGETAVRILESYLGNPHVSVSELFRVIDGCIYECRTYAETETMKKMRDTLMPVFASSELLKGRTKSLAVFKKKIADYICEYE